MMGINFIRDMMRADIDPTPPSLPEPKKFTFISRLARPITDWNCRGVWIEDLLTRKPREYRASTDCVVMYENTLYTWNGRIWLEFHPGPCTNYDGPIPDKKVYLSSSPVSDSPLAKSVREQTDALMEKLGIGCDYPSSIEQDGNIVRFKHDLRYIGETATNIHYMPKKRNVSIMFHGVWSKDHYARIGDVVTYKDVEYVYSGDETGWTPINDRRKESDKDMATTHYDRVRPNWLNITKVVFNDPATIVFWGDGTKTVVKCSDNETFDPEKGLVMAIAKKAFGNQGRYYNQIKKWLPEEEERPTVSVDGNAILGALKSKLEAAGATLDVRRTDETE